MPRSREELLAETARFQEILDSGVREQLVALPGVTQVSFGLKEVGGRPTDEFSVKVYVEEKLPVDRLAAEQVVPATVAEVPTDVCPQPEPEPQTSVHGGITVTNGIVGKDPADPTKIGFGEGTLGFVARRDEKPHRPVMLTSAHVFDSFGGAVGDPVFHPAPETDTPGPLPHKPTKTTNLVGTIVDIKNTEHVDGAIAEVDTCYSCCCNCGTGFSHTIPGLQINGSDELAGTDHPIRGMEVFKVGVTTGRTAGVITDVGLEIPSSTGPRNKDQIRILSTVTGKRFSDHGDSGSVIVDRHGKVVGLLMAGDAEPPPGPNPPPDPSTLATYANAIQHVMSELKIWFPANPDSATTATGAVTMAEPAHVDEAGLFDVLTERFGRSEIGRRLRDVITAHGQEIVELVNNRRRVTVAWHRGQGPTWLASFARSARHPDYRLPDAIEGVTRSEVVSALHTVLQVEGSDELRGQLRELPDFLVSALAECHTVDELLSRLDEPAEQRS